MKIKFNDGKLEIKDYQRLDNDTDQAFSDLYTSFLNDPEKDYGNLVEN